MKRTTRWARVAAVARREAARATVLGAIAFGLPARARGQESPSTPEADRSQACAEKKVGSLGLTGWDCRGDCTLTLDESHEAKAWSFSVEPRISGVVPGGPADGILQAGDVLVAIDGLLITTKDGGERIVDLPPDADVKVRFRRGGRIAEATIHTAAECRTSWEAPAPPMPPLPPEPATVPARVVTPRIRATAPPRRDSALPRPPTPPPPPGSARLPGEGTPRPRLGIGFQCGDCGTRVDSVSGVRVWFFSEPPEVTAVDAGGPADRAGIRIGDRIVAVDGIPIATDAGGRAFTAVRPDVGVRVTVAKRSGREETVTLVPEWARRVPEAATPAPAEPAPEPPLPPEATPAPEGLPLRYSGTLAGVEVEVRGESVVVSSDARGTRTIVIRSGGLWIRIRVPPAGGG